jgi:hypothetical protein
MTELSISQVLRYASKLKNQISEARTRAQRSLNHQKDQSTAFDFYEMFNKANSLSDELAALQGKLASANANNTVDYKGNKITLGHAVRILEELKGRISWIKGLNSLDMCETKSSEKVWDETSDKYVLKETITVCALPEADKADRCERLQEEFDLLNGAVESANHIVKIVL